MRIKAANKGIVTPDLMDVLGTDTMVLGITTVEAIGIAQQGPHAVPTWMKDIVAGPAVGAYVGGTEVDDTLHGTDFADDLFGFGGNDSLFGGLGDDQLYGGTGHDCLTGGAGADLLNGGAGADTASYAGGSHGVTVDLTAGTGYLGTAEGDTYVSIENVIGTLQADVIIGNSADNVLDGSGGNDQIVGGAGRDTLIGGNGFDTLTGDMAGIMAADTFVFTPFSGGAFITDFQHGLDKIQLSGFGIDSLGPDGELAWGDGDSSRSLSLDDTLYFDTRTHTLYQIDPKPGGDGVRLNIVAEIVTLGDDVHRLTTDDLIFI